MDFAQMMNGDLPSSVTNTSVPAHAIESATNYTAATTGLNEPANTSNPADTPVAVAVNKMMKKIIQQLPLGMSAAATAVVEEAMASPQVNHTALLAFLAFMMFRYTRTVVSIGTYTLYKPKPLAADPKFTSEDVTVIIPTTFKAPAELLRCVRRVLACDPFKVYVVTSEENVPLVKELLVAEDWDQEEIVVLGVEALNKRRQILEALKEVKTEIAVLADDDVFWPKKHGNYLNYLLAIFEDDEVGAGGTRQRVRRTDNPTFVDFLGICYLERRVWNNATTNAIDGSISTLSGRTAAYRTEILQNETFYHYFMNDTWRGKPLNSDDDKCLTRYVYSAGWKIALQFDPRSILETTVEPDWTGYRAQCLRWARAHWRGNFTVMENEQYWRSLRMLWGFYVIYVGQFQTPAIFWDSFHAFLLYSAVGGTQYAVASYVAFGLWVFFTKILKLIPHFCQYPSDLKFIPGMIGFSYLHGFLNIYAAMTMTTTHWGSKNIVEEAKPLINPTIPEKVDAFVEKVVLAAKTPAPSPSKEGNGRSSEDSGMAELK